jgi:hypothetical protein
MKKIEINTCSDHYDCETCGDSYAEGGSVIIDGKTVLEVEPMAHCYGGTSVTEGELLILALNKLGVKIRVDGQKPYVMDAELSEELE